jgi:hypothetical protein
LVDEIVLAASEVAPIERHSMLPADFLLVEEKLGSRFRVLLVEHVRMD